MFLIQKENIIYINAFSQATIRDWSDTQWTKPCNKIKIITATNVIKWRRNERHRFEKQM